MAREASYTSADIDMNIVELQVHAVIKENRVQIVDRQGQRIGRSRSLIELVGPLDEVVGKRLRWEQATQRMVWRLASRATTRAKTPWQVRTDSLAASFRLRGRMRSTEADPTGRRHHEAYLTITWKDAVGRMWAQANNRFRRHARTGWAKWACTVSNNHNKRKDRRYEKASSCDG